MQYQGFAPAFILLLVALAASLGGAIGLKIIEAPPGEETPSPQPIEYSTHASLLSPPTLWEETSVMSNPLVEDSEKTASELDAPTLWEEGHGWVGTSTETSASGAQVSSSAPPESDTSTASDAVPERENPKEATSNSEGVTTSSSGAGATPPLPLIKILISEVQISGVNADDEFVELYNPNGESLNLSGWKLTKKSGSGSEYNLISAQSFKDSVPAHGYFLIAHPEWSSSSSANLIYSNRSAPLANNNSLLLYDSVGRVVDKLGWGDAPIADFEGTQFGQNPSAGQSLERKSGALATAESLRLGEDRYAANGYDSDNNAQDFVLRPAPQAQNASAFREPRFAPQRITDLGVSVSGTLAVLSWTTPADTDSPQSSLRYDIRRLTSPISEDNWTSASAVDSGVGIGESGTIASTTLVGLAEGGTYYFGVKTQDDTEAISPLSNIASVSVATATTPASHSPQATAARSIVINEIAWMGTASSTNDEWLELFSNATAAVDLSGWQLVISGAASTLTFQSGTTIAVGGFWLLERTNDEPVSDISADVFFTGALSNTGAKLELRSSDGVLVDAVDASSGWFAGLNEGAGRRVSMERINPSGDGSAASNWAPNDELTTNGLDAGGNSIRGTPRARNSRTPP